MSHTPEPYQRDGLFLVHDATPNRIGNPIAEFSHEADLLRVMVCVNGCAGLNPAAYAPLVKLIQRFKEQNWQIKTVDLDEIEQALAHAQEVT